MKRNKLMILGLIWTDEQENEPDNFQIKNKNVTSSETIFHLIKLMTSQEHQDLVPSCFSLKCTIKDLVFKVIQMYSMSE